MAEVNETVAKKKPAAKKAAAKKAPRLPIPKMREIWDYYSLDFKITREFIGTCTETSIMTEHVLKKAQKEIKKANRISGKINKAAEKYRGAEYTDDKMVKDIQNNIRTFAELAGKQVDEMPDDMDELLELAEIVEAEYREIVSKAEQKATVFMRKKIKGKEGPGNEGGTWPIISTHMILGNLKENARVITNNGDNSVFPSKVSIGEVMSLDVKAIEQYMVPSHDIKRKENGERELLERPIRFERMGKSETAISISEVLPVGTEFGCTLRVRRRGPVTEEALRFLLELGKNNGLGSWRGSGNMGSYRYKLQKLPSTFEEPVPEGFEGWD